MNNIKIILFYLLLWIPRIICILITAFTSVFAFDVFGQGNGILGTFLDFLFHLIPTIIMIIILGFSWRRQWIGGIACTGLGIAFLIWSSHNPGAYTVGIYLPLFLCGLLFLLGWFFREEIKKSQDTFNEKY